jgi:NAD(P)-dependent dehydrogenase (short-subunit alcohol dehydrogenase family)
MHIQDSTVLVTGANRGIGKAFADALLDRGATKVYAGVRDVAAVTDPRLVPVELDVTDPERIAEVARELDDVQVVVNNAGVLHVGVPLSASLDVARLELETNYLSLVSMTQAFAPVLERNGGGAFENVLSVFSWVAAPLITTYSASKAAAWSFTNAARIELRRQGTA